MTDSNSTLNDLIATTLDSAKGYEEAATETRNSQFSTMFTRRAQERRQVVQQLRQCVTQAGGTPQDDGTILGSMHRSWTSLRASVSGSDQAVVNEVERGEDHIKAKYESAMQDNALSPQARSAVQTAFTSVKAGHDEMSRLKHSLQHAA